MAKRSALERVADWLSEEGKGRPAPALRRKTAGGRRMPAAARHNRKCKVCRHTHRKDIEQDFLRWHSPDRIAKDYGIADHSSVYRHAHATGLFKRRFTTIRLALEPLIEQAEIVNVTADAIVQAIRLYAELNANETGDRSEPNRQTARANHNATR